jgi:hypothetical protein
MPQKWHRCQGGPGKDQACQTGWVQSVQAVCGSDAARGWVDAPKPGNLPVAGLGLVCAKGPYLLPQTPQSLLKSSKVELGTPRSFGEKIS